MKNVKALFLTATISLIASPVCSAEEPTPASIQELMRVTGGEKLADQLLNQVFATMAPSYGNQLSETRRKYDRVAKRFREEVNMTELFELMIPVYQKHMSQATVDAAVEFYTSPNGQKFVDASPAIQAESFQIGAAWGRDLALKIQQEMEK